jgi:glycosyltransferase involved in cell wall biosynthesis
MRSDDIVVSCLMPTRGRRTWLPGAVAGFLRQRVAAAELLIVSEDDCPASLLRLSPRLRHVPCPPGLPLGEKRNFACAAARGRFLVHWDDDDLQASERLHRQLRTLAAAGGGVTGSSRIHFRDTTSGRCWEYHYDAPHLPWVHGATLAYTRAYWRRHPFPAIPVGEDNLFVWAADPGELHDTRDAGLCLCSLHRRNTSPKETTDAWWRPIPLPRRWRTLIRAARSRDADSRR